MCVSAVGGRSVFELPCAKDTIWRNVAKACAVCDCVFRFLRNGVAVPFCCNFMRAKWACDDLDAKPGDLVPQNMKHWLACPEQLEPWYCADNVSMLTCKQASLHMVWMYSKRARPKERACCAVCFAWVIGENLAEPVGDPSRLTSPSYDKRTTRCVLRVVLAMIA